MKVGEGQQRLLERLRDCLGPQVLKALAEPGVTEVMLNPDGQLFVEQIGGIMEPLGTLSRSAAETALGLVAHADGAVIDQDQPIISSTMPPEGWRIEGILPPLVAAPCFAIRKPAVLGASLGSLAQIGTLSEPGRRLLADAALNRCNILIAGGTGSGKTTLADALLQAIGAACPQHRIVVLEDTPELGQRVANQVSLRTTKTVDMTQLLRSTLRLRPDRIIVGELRDGAALTLLKAWNTGHDGGLTTIHAGSTRAAITRLEQLVAEVSRASMAPVIAEAVDLVVVIARTRQGRRVTEINRVEGYSNGQYQLVPLLMEDDNVA